AAARKRSSGPLKARPHTPASVGVSAVKNSRPVVVSHTRTGPAGLPAASHLPLALNVTLVHDPVHGPPVPRICPVKSRRHVKRAASQAVTLPSCPTVASHLPSGL